MNKDVISNNIHSWGSTDCSWKLAERSRSKKTLNLYQVQTSKVRQSLWVGGIFKEVRRNLAWKPSSFSILGNILRSFIYAPKWTKAKELPSHTHTVSHRGQFKSLACLPLHCIFKYDELMIRDNKTPQREPQSQKIKEEIYKYIWNAYQIKAFFSALLETYFKT